MSYILEALKKSNKERQHQSTSLPIKDLAPLISKQRRTKLPLLSLSLLIAIGVVTSGGFVFLKNYSFTLKEAQPEVTEDTIPIQLSPNTTQAPLQPSVIALEPEIIEPAPIYDFPYEIQNLEQMESLPLKYPELITVKELPVEIQNQLPNLEFAGHTYSQEPTARLILINNKILREGHKITNNLTLQEIIPEGVVLNYKSIEFQVLINL